MTMTPPHQQAHRNTPVCEQNDGALVMRNLRASGAIRSIDEPESRSTDRGAGGRRANARTMRLEVEETFTMDTARSRVLLCPMMQ